MQLIVNPTSKCNFACTFCGASNPLNDLTVDEAVNYAKEIKAQEFIINGGDPLMMPPLFYEQLIEKTGIRIDIVSNLKDFYYNPEKWVSLFKNPMVSVCTSFNYGNSRRWDKDTPYTEEMFIKVVTKFKEYVGYVPFFIAVLDEDNFDTALDHLYLAKRLGTKCRLNNALKMGRQGTYFPRWKMFKLWCEIVEAGLADYEQNCWERSIGRCPLNLELKCRNQIRVIQKENGEIKHYHCSNDALRRENSLDNEDVQEERITNVFFPKCYYCELFSICNACSAEKRQVIDKEEYCKEMTEIKPRLIKNGWKI